MSENDPDYTRLRFIKTQKSNIKRPKESWGGYDQDFDQADDVYTYEDVESSPHDNWAVVGIDDRPHMSLSLLVFDLDIHEAPADFDPNDISLEGDTLVVQSQSGGLHVYFVTHAERNELSESDFEMNEALGWDIDIRGSSVGQYVVAPSDIPGVDTPYTVTNNAPIKTVFDPAQAAERIQYNGDPLLEYNPNEPDDSDFNFDHIGQPPEDMPTCYYRGLELRENNPDDHPNPHKVNALTALVGLFAGYGPETIVQHFVDEFPPGSAADREKTKYQVNHLAEKVENGDYLPPSASTLREYGILDTDETCNCSVHDYDESSDSGNVISPKEIWEWWSEKRQSGAIGEDNLVPTSALHYIAREQNLYNFENLPDDADSLPPKAHNLALKWLKHQWPDQESVNLDLDDDESVTKRGSKPRDESIYTWEDVRYIYQKDKKKGRYAAVTHLRSKYEFLTPEDTEQLHVYDEDLGIFDDTAKFEIGRELDRNLEKYYSQHEKNEIIGRLKEKTVERRTLEARHKDGEYVCLKNGVLDLENRDLLDHDPSYNFTQYLPREYDPDVVPERILRFLRDITKREEDVLTLLEMLGHTLRPNYEPSKFLVIFGEGENGKSTWFEVVRSFLNGIETETRNVRNLSLQQVTDNRFGPSNLIGKWANIGEDLPQTKVQDIGTLKDLTGGGESEAEPKGEDMVEFENRATMMFGANRPPLLPERSRAVKRRLVPVHLPYHYETDPDDEDEFAKQARDKDQLLEELITSDELDGLLNLALDGLDRLRANGDVSLPESKEERLELYEQKSDFIKAFRVNCLENTADDRVEKDVIYNTYTNYCNEKNKSVVNKSTFFKKLGQTTLNVNTVRLPKQEDGSRPRALHGVTLTDEGLRCAPDSYRQETGDGSGSSASEKEEYTKIETLDVGRHAEILATISTVSDGEYTREAQGTLRGPHGTFVDFVIPGDNEDIATEFEGQMVRIENAKMRTDDDGLPELVINDAVSVTPVNDSQQIGLYSGSEAAADGGSPSDSNDRGTDIPDDAVNTRAKAQRIANIFRTHGITDADSGVTSSETVDLDEVELPSDVVESALEYGAKDTNPALFQRDRREEIYWLST